MPGSAEAAQVLSAHLPGLSVHLSEEHVPVSTVTMEKPSGGLEASVGQSLQQNAQQQETPRGAAPGSNLQVNTGAGFHRPEASRLMGSSDSVLLPLFDSECGTRVSVMA
jgi:hypothetical protein